MRVALRIGMFETIANLETITGGTDCRVFNFGSTATFTPAGGQPIDVSPGSSGFPGVGSVPEGKFGLSIDGQRFRDTQGAPRLFECRGQDLTTVPGPNGPGLFGG